MLSGRYRDFKLCSKWDNGLESCRLPGCNFPIGDVQHFLSGECPALRNALVSSLTNSLRTLQASFPFLVPPVLSALRRGSLEWSKFVLDPSTDVTVISLKQEHGPTVVWPLFRLSRAFVWSMQREIENS